MASWVYQKRTSCCIRCSYIHILNLKFKKLCKFVAVVSKEQEQEREAAGPICAVW